MFLFNFAPSLKISCAMRLQRYKKINQKPKKK